MTTRVVVFVEAGLGAGVPGVGVRVAIYLVGSGVVAVRHGVALDDTIRVPALVQFRVQPGNVLVRFLMAVDAGRGHGEVREAVCGLGMGCLPSRP